MDKILGEAWLFSGDFAPKGTVFARGQLLPTSQYPSFFSILGVRYGGDGTQNFGVPDLQGLEPEGVNYLICAFGNFPTRE